jgi:Putative Flp pilus-assembly TadE/G-like
MLTREKFMRDQKFKDSEDGALLVFFAICCAAIFLIAALSFDLGRRASTQTELQSFADNVALAAAGELNGFPGAITRARTAADELISDSFVFGDGDRLLAGDTDYSIYFYESLPADDQTVMSNAACGSFPAPLCQNVPANDFIARFVRVEVNEVDVPWVFANLLSMFSSDPLPDEAVAARAVAGYTSLACDIAPVFFCLPPPDALDAAAGDIIWDPENHIGDQVLLRTGQGGNSFWDSGNFGWLDPRDTIPEESLVDPDGDCYGLNGAPLLVCLIAAENAVTTCFENGLLTTLPGQKQGIESAVFNTRFDMFNSVVSQYADDENFQPAPIITRGFVDSGGDACLKNSVQYEDTMAFPTDDCFGFVDGGPNCDAWDGVVRFGDGDWTQGRLDYVEANYSMDGESYTTILPSEIDADGYHVDDPFSPTNALANGFVEIQNGASRWEYYVAEVTATYYDSPAAAYATYMANPDSGLGDPKATVTSLMPPLLFDGDNNDPEIPSTYDDDYTVDRAEDGLPYCATDPDEGGPDNFSLDPRRRVVIAAVVDCNAQQVKGNTKDVLATYFVETFITQPVKGDPTDKKKFDMWIEIIGPALNTGSSVVEKGVFRNLVQLYR